MEVYKQLIRQHFCTCTDMQMLTHWRAGYITLLYNVDQTKKPIGNIKRDAYTQHFLTCLYANVQTSLMWKNRVIVAAKYAP